MQTTHVWSEKQVSGLRKNVRYFKYLPAEEYKRYDRVSSVRNVLVTSNLDGTDGIFKFLPNGLVHSYSRLLFLFSS